MWVGGNSDLLGSQKHHWGSLEHKNPKVFSYHSWIFDKYSNYIMSNCSRNANVINIFFERRKPWTFQTFYNPLKAFRAINHDSLQQFCERLTLLHPAQGRLSQNSSIRPTREIPTFFLFLFMKCNFERHSRIKISWKKALVYDIIEG